MKSITILSESTSKFAGTLLVEISLAWWLAVGSTPAQAEPIPFSPRSVSLTAREQPIADFLQDLFGPQDIPVVVSASVKGAVNGYFSGPTRDVYRKLARSFNLVEYYDGTVLHVYAPHEVSTRTLVTSVEVAEQTVRLVQEMRLGDARNAIRSSNSGALVVSGTQRFIEQVEEIVRSQAINRRLKSPFGALKVFYLRYAWAHDVSIHSGGRQVTVPGVASIVRAMMLNNSRSRMIVAENEQAPRSAAVRSRGAQPPRTGTLGSPGADPDQPSAPTLAAAHGRPASQAAREGTVTPVPGTASGADDPISSMLVPGDVRVEADSRLNAVIVRDTPDRLAEYEQLIASLDVEPQSIEIEATIIDVNTDKTRELGVNWRLSGSHASVLYGRGDSSDLLLAPGTPAAAIAPQGRGGFVSAVLGNSLQFVGRVNALQEQGAARVVSSPQVITLSNVEALFDSSQTFYVRVAGRDEVDLFNVSAGTVMRVTPHVFKDRGEVRIKLLVAIEDGSLSARSVDGLPVVDRSSIDTQALIFEGESLLIGGITRQSTLDEQSQVPFLGSLPVVGGLFRNTKTGTSRIERMFLISPRLVPRRQIITAPPVAPQPAPATPAAPEITTHNKGSTGEEP